MKWEVRIDGPDAILRQLAMVVSAQDIQVENRDSTFILSGSRLDAWDNVTSVRREAERITSLLSGSARLSLGCTESLQVGEVTEVGAERAGGGSESDPDSWPRRSSLSRTLREALSNPAMEQALRLRDAGDLNRGELVQIYQVIERATGGRPAVMSFGGVTDLAIERLQHMSNGAIARDAPGDEHGHSGMTLTEARHFVDRLLMAWFASVTLSAARSQP